MIQMHQYIPRNLVFYTQRVSIRNKHRQSESNSLLDRKSVPSNCSRYCGSCMDVDNQLRTSSTVHSVTSPFGIFAGIGDACCKSPILASSILSPTLYSPYYPPRTNDRSATVANVSFRKITVERICSVDEQRSKKWLLERCQGGGAEKNGGVAKEPIV
jgi:hypothetical protein